MTESVDNIYLTREPAAAAKETVNIDADHLDRMAMCVKLRNNANAVSSAAENLFSFAKVEDLALRIDSTGSIGVEKRAR